MAKYETLKVESVISQKDIPIDINNISEIPESYIWSEQNNDHKDLFISTTSKSDDFVVPVIDMKDSANVILLMRKALEEYGIFQVINHGINLELLQETKGQARKLFSLPMEQKLKALKPNGSRTSGYGYAKISKFFDKLMWSEGFSFEGSISDVASKLWPQECDASTTFCNVINEFDDALKELSHKILSMLLTSLGLTLKDDVKWLFTPNNSLTNTERLLQMNSYPIPPDPNQTMGLAAHTDSSLLTIVYPGNTIGLQIYHREKWVSVKTTPGALVVNTGDLLTILSNGIFKSVLHRVLNSREHRVSVVYFLAPPKGVSINSPLKLVKDGEFPLYRSITWNEYLSVKANYYNETLDQIRFDDSTKV